jgi:hypothetical protein
MKLLPTHVAGQGISSLRSGDPLWWLRDREALVRRFVLSQVMGEPKSRQRRRGPPTPPVSGGRR